MKSRSLLLGVILGAAVVAPIAATPSGYGVARADEIAMPRSQAEFDQFSARLDNPDSAAGVAQLNRVGHAFDNGESRLFWFTDLDAARALAKRENKPILSLRLLGNLSDELSCANSRLFRVLLYPNAQINRQLREGFVLHWSSERPVPVATIDMGDGRVLKRTLTGNSAHYLLSAEGQPLDVLPGLYAPAEFATWLQRGADLARDWNATPSELQPKMLSDWHRARLVDIYKSANNASAVEQANRTLAANFLGRETPATRAVSAREISDLALPKSRGELPILEAMGQSRTVPLLGDIPLIGGLFRSPISSVTYDVFDAATRARIVAMQPQSDPQSLIYTMEVNVARDTRNNQRNFEPPIHAYFVNQLSPDFVDNDGFSNSSNPTNPYLSRQAVSGLIKPEPLSQPMNRESVYFANEAKVDFDKLNRAIYDKLFRTPASDLWLGLAPADAFVAISNGGVQNGSLSQPRVAQNP